MPLDIHMTTPAVAVVLMAGALAFGGPVALAAVDAGHHSAVLHHDVREDPIYMDVTSDNHEEVMDISRQRPVILFFEFDACGGCQELKPVIHGFAEDDGGKWMLGQIDTDVSPELADRWQIDGCPTLIAVKNGQEVLRKLAYNGEPESIRSWVDEALAAEEPQPGQ